MRRQFGASFPVRGDLLRAQRLRNAWTQADLAARAGLSDRLIRKAEKGGPLRRSSIRVLAETLGVPERALMHGKDAGAGRPMAEKAKYFLLQIWNHGNLQVIEELLLPEFRFHHEQGVVCNRDQMRQRIAAFAESFSDFEFLVDEVDDFGDFVLLRWRFALTHSGPWLDLEPTHRRRPFTGRVGSRCVTDSLETRGIFRILNCSTERRGLRNERTFR